MALALSAMVAGPAAAQHRSAPHQRVDSKTACAYTGDSTAALQTLSTSVGRPIDCALLFSDNTLDWVTWEQPWLIRNTYPDYRWAPWLAAKPGRRVVITQALVPGGLPSDWRSEGASGEYDDHIRAWAANMVNGGFGSATIRLGHEANGDWYFDSIGSKPSEYAAWAAYWARFVRIAKAVPGAHFTFDWTVAAGYRGIPFSSYYPGDRAVDIVGIDQYDGMAIAPRRLPTTPKAHWDALLSQQWGLDDLVTFAADHRKPISIPEWGLLTAGSANGTGMGDDPSFVDGIAGIVRSNPTSYEAIWDTRSATSPIATAIEDTPRSLAEYRRHFGYGGDASGTTLHPSAPAVVVGPRSRTDSVPTYITAQSPGRSPAPGRQVTVKALLVIGPGHAPRGQRLLLQRLVAKHWSTVTAATTGKDGRLILHARPLTSTVYRVVLPLGAGKLGAASMALTVRVSSAGRAR